MNPDDILALVTALDPNNRKISTALAFIRQVVKNNPQKSAAEIVKRPDVKDALDVIDSWVSDSKKVLTTVVANLPTEVGKVIEKQVTQTLDQLTEDTRVNDAHIAVWSDSDETPESWAAKIVLRMIWLVEWLRKQVEGLTLNAPYKRWVSRLDASTCKYCRGLHGAVIPVGKSFAAAAAKVGYTRIYGGLDAPPLHPRCRCKLVGVSQAEFDKLS